MINVSIKKSNGIIDSVKIIGHAKYNDFGKDIVCAGASSILTTTVNAILEFDKSAISFKEGNNFSLMNIKKDEVTNRLLENMYKLFIDLETQYKGYIKIKEEN